MSFCDHCVQGVRHEGTAEGKWETIDGIECYVATPSKDYPKDKVLILLTDVFGSTFINNQLIADGFAANGIKTVMPTLFRDIVTPDILDTGKFDFPTWFPRNNIDYSEPRVRKVVAALQAQGVTRFAASGYCYGARSSFNLAFEGIIHVVAVSHPSMLKIPEDIETYAAKAKAPLLINSCEVDPQFPASASEQTDQILGGGKFAPGYLRTYWEGCTHGFAVRGDTGDPKIKAGKEGSFKASVEWIIKHL